MEIIIISLIMLISTSILIYIFFRINIERLYLKELEDNFHLQIVNKKNLSLIKNKVYPSDAQL